MALPGVYGGYELGARSDGIAPRRGICKIAPRLWPRFNSLPLARRILQAITIENADHALLMLAGHQAHPRQRAEYERHRRTAHAQHARQKLMRQPGNTE